MNILFSLLGIFIWSFAHFYFLKSKKDKAKEKINYGAYVADRWDDWAWCIMWAAVLLVVGHYGLGLEFLRAFNSDLTWSDLWYFGSGPISMMATKGYEEIIERFKSKDA
jgi:hypothetical protein